MSTPDLDLVQALVGANAVVVVTGAGMSTASGIPDYRGPNGVWRNKRPVMYSDFLDDPVERARDWALHAEAWRLHHQARPNAAHLALARLEQAGKLELVITQNIDGLHRRAGHAPDRVVELHGTAAEVECLSCGQRRPADAFYTQFELDGIPPACPCGGWWKPAVINFGQGLRAADVERAQEAILRADLVIALGSTLQVQPAATFPLLAARSGVPYFIINQGPTEHDDHPLVSKRIEGDLLEVLPAAVDAALSMSA